MNEEKMRLPGSERVKIIGGLNPKLMEIADPSPELIYGRLTKEELAKVIQVGMKYQTKIIEAEMVRLRAATEAIGEMQKVISGFK